MNAKFVAKTNKDGQIQGLATDSAPALYFYHPDHLGGTAMVTDLDGRITQNVVYIPYGEVFVEERNGSWASSYLFNAGQRVGLGDRVVLLWGEIFKSFYSFVVKY